MMRTQARQSSLGQDLTITPCLASLACDRCGKIGVMMVVFGRNDNGAIEQAYCSIPCAIKAGFPWLASETPSSKRPKAC